MIVSALHVAFVLIQQEQREVDPFPENTFELFFNINNPIFFSVFVAAFVVLLAYYVINKQMIPRIREHELEKINIQTKYTKSMAMLAEAAPDPGPPADHPDPGPELEGRRVLRRHACERDRCCEQYDEHGVLQAPPGELRPRVYARDSRDPAALAVPHEPQPLVSDRPLGAKPLRDAMGRSFWSWLRTGAARPEPAGYSRSDRRRLNGLRKPSS